MTKLFKHLPKHTRYGQVFTGDSIWIKRKGHLIACCDCGLVHDFIPRLKNGRLYMRIVTKYRNTAALRRTNNFRCKPVKRVAHG